ncbi:MAG TPA: LysE family transporter [Oligoflexia bacterium]|nr:LysE family transporter [Oligoflexia bacterium]
MEVIDVLAFALCGFTGGIVSSAPIGPINLQVLQMHRSGRSTFAFVLGVVLADVALAGLAYFGYAKFISKQQTEYLFLIAGFLLICLGLKEHLQRKQPPRTDVRMREARFRHFDFWFGASICLSNPTFLAFWVLWTTSTLPVFSPSATALTPVVFLSGIFMGDFLWFSFLGRFARVTKSSRTLALIQRFTAGLTILFGGFLLAKGFYGIFKSS